MNMFFFYNFQEKDDLEFRGLLHQYEREALVIIDRAVDLVATVKGISVV